MSNSQEKENQVGGMVMSEEEYPMNFMLVVNDGFFHCEPIKNEDITQETLNGLLYAVSLLPERIQKMIRLRYEEGQTYSKIAKEMGVTAERIRFLLRDAEAKLRRPNLYWYIKKGRCGTAVDDSCSESEESQTDIMRMEIKDMGMSVRTTNRLIAGGCHVVADVVAMKKETILKLKLVGKMTRDEVKFKLESMGITDSAWSNIQ